MGNKGLGGSVESNGISEGFDIINVLGGSDHPMFSNDMRLGINPDLTPQEFVNQYGEVIENLRKNLGTIKFGSDGYELTESGKNLYDKQKSQSSQQKVEADL